MNRASLMDVTDHYEFIGFGAMGVTKPNEFIGFGAKDVTKFYEFIGFGAMDVTKPYEFIGFGAVRRAGTGVRLVPHLLRVRGQCRGGLRGAVVPKVRRSRALEHVVEQARQH